MSSHLLGFMWLAASVVVCWFAVTTLQPLRESAATIVDGGLRQAKLARLDAAMAACMAFVVTSVPYLFFGAFVPSIIGWRISLVVDLLIVLPLLALGLMQAFARLVPDRLAPSWRRYGGYLKRAAHILMLLVLLPVLLTHNAAPVWLYPALLYASCFAMLFNLYRRGRGGAKAAGDAA